MATTLKQIQSQKQKLAPRQVLNARLLQLNVVNLEQTILKELEQKITTQKNLLLVGGMGGIGKSFLCREFFNNLIKI